MLSSVTGGQAISWVASDAVNPQVDSCSSVTETLMRTIICSKKERFLLTSASTNVKQSRKRQRMIELHLAIVNEMYPYSNGPVWSQWRGRTAANETIVLAILVYLYIQCKWPKSVYYAKLRRN